MLYNSEEATAVIKLAERMISADSKRYAEEEDIAVSFFEGTSYSEYSDLRRRATHMSLSEAMLIVRCMSTQKSLDVAEFIMDIMEEQIGDVSLNEIHLWEEYVNRCNFPNIAFRHLRERWTGRLDSEVLDAFEENKHYFKSNFHISIVLYLVEYRVKRSDSSMHYKEWAQEMTKYFNDEDILNGDDRDTIYRLGSACAAACFFAGMRFSQ